MLQWRKLKEKMRDSRHDSQDGDVLRQTNETLELLMRSVNARAYKMFPPATAR